MPAFRRHVTLYTTKRVQIAVTTYTLILEVLNSYLGLEAYYLDWPGFLQSLHGNAEILLWYGHGHFLRKLFKYITDQSTYH
jgi:hypothetical protein